MRSMTLLVAIVLGAACAAAEAPSGVVIDASALAIKRARFPRLYDRADAMLYPTEKLCDDPNYQGFEGYEPSMSAALSDRERVGASPLVIPAVVLKKGDPLEGSVVISNEDAAVLRDLNKKHKLLDKDRLVIVIGLTVLHTSPDRDAQQVKVASPVEVVFSKPLSDECWQRNDLLTVTDKAGAPVTGQVEYDRKSRTIHFVPSSKWAYGTTYIVTVSRSAEADGLGQLGSDFSFSFTTESGEPDAGSSSGGSGGSTRV